MNLLLVNPWITDFKAYDEWMRPLPLYRFMERYASRHRVTLLDCLDAPLKRKRHSTAFFRSEEIEKPPVFRSIPRRFRRYGISLSEFRAGLARCGRPDAVLVTTLMTYWYPGVETAAREIRAAWPGVPVFLGGVYAALLPAHAGQYGGVSPEIGLAGPLSFLGADAMRGVLPLRLVRGCPDNCPYCASRAVHQGNVLREALEENLERLAVFAGSGGEDVVFYDDAPLYRFDDVMGPFLKGILNAGYKIRLHFPNGMHARMLDDQKTGLMRAAGAGTIRLGFERSGNEKKGDAVHVRKAVRALMNAGFQGKDIGAYLMLGLEKGLAAAGKDAAFLHDLGVKVYINQLSPVPGSALYGELADEYPEIVKEPLYHNDLTWIFTHGGFDWNEVWDFKHGINELNERL